MTKNMHFFSRNKYVKNRETWEIFGLRGKQAMEFAALDLPILPGFIIDASVTAHLDHQPDMKRYLKNYIGKCESDTGKRFGDKENPLLVKIVISPNLAIVSYPTLHNFGLTDETIPGFNQFVGEDFGYHEVLFLIKGYLQIEEKIAQLEERQKDAEKITSLIENLQKGMEKNDKAEKFKSLMEEYRRYLPEDFFSDAYTQLEIVLKTISKMLAIDELDDEDAALIVQPMVYGNYGKNSASGEFFTRNIVTGEKKLEGWFEQNRFNSIESEGKEIAQIEKPIFAELEKVAGIVEDHFKEIRSIRFTVENGKVWLIDQRPLMSKSVQADVKTLLDLYARKIISREELITAFKPDQLNEILHPVIDVKSTKSMERIDGGIAGAPGAAIGRIYFSTETLLDAYKSAQQKGEDTRLILCMPATFAEDVKAIEVSTGVLSAEGGYSAHASVVARQYGKVSLVNFDLKFRGKKKALIGKVELNEGDLVTLNVPHYGEPTILLGEAQLIEPDPKQSGLLDFIDVVKKEVSAFHVRVNADKPRDAELARTFGAEGIGLCRTEHMFFQEERINVFREMIMSDNREERLKVLKKLKKMQQSDFYQIFKAMEGKEVTIRLLDAPLHEFLPHNDEQMKAFLDYLKTSGGKSMSQREVRERCDALAEFNPMLGHRGCRIAVSYPEIYEMQMEAIFEAAYKLVSEGKKVAPEIMIPLIMNHNELKLIIYGKKIEGNTYRGLAQVEEQVRERLGAKPLDYKFGTMIELPVAALGAGEIARYAQFFSFGTNDLTQTTIGLSRDDYTSFMPDYTLFDILSGNPFQILDEHVKELISIAVRRGTLTRPGLTKGLCGEHGAVPSNIAFCMDAGLDYVSCSVYSVPIALLAVAQQNIERRKA
ncbi:putative PEP-binding protein [Sediminispirochaeta bajacaliforniensis]|uniref:putative PEP-binding protein n=1 Tax=Sediminispirochaeta bajacaliforniensis TaxID=148 RepID=UPI0003757355|nr:putative PEP-binding protein [Sediminispirochaeta bajacaliforniensis]